MRQRPLHLAAGPDLSFATLVEGDSNRAALGCVRAFPDWPAPVLLLLGPQGAGKTHIGSAARERFGVRFIDDADGADEIELFGAINAALAGETGGLVLASRRAPGEWGVETPDLASRLGNVPVFRLDEPGDDILSPVVLQLFLDRGRMVGADVADYMLSRCSRSVAELERVVDAVEAEAQSERADVTKAFVSRFLARQPDLFEA